MTRIALMLGCLLLVAAVGRPLMGDPLSVTNQRLLEDVKYLASDELEGRGPGTNGINLAATYIREQFLKSGLAMDRVDGGAFQKFDLTIGTKLVDPNSIHFVTPNGDVIELRSGVDYNVCSFAGAGSFDGEVVFCGYGIEANEVPYSDYEGIDVTGKVVLIMRRTPRQSDQTAAHSFAEYADLRSKMIRAQAHKAAAVLIVNDSFSGRKAAEKRIEDLKRAADKVVVSAEELVATDVSNSEKSVIARNAVTAAVNQLQSIKEASIAANDDELMTFGYAGYGDSTSVPPAIHMTQKQADKLLAALQTGVATLEQSIDSDLKPRSIAIPGWRVRGILSMEKIKTQVFNVIGVIDGEGALADETVVIGAHYDHVGRGGSASLSPGSTEIHNGADDNASGTSSLIELARRYGAAAKIKKPARRMVFIAFTGEEIGLLGSARYCKEPVFSLEKTIAMFNMDMVGRLKADNKLIVYGTATSPRWEPELTQFNRQSNFHLIFKPEGFGPSDHSSFYAKKIPVLHFFTGEHPDYHRPSDDWDKLNIDGLARVTEIIEKVVSATVAAPERPPYVEVKGSATINRGGNRPYFGSIPEFGNEEPGYSISGVASGSPADKGGLKGGDRIVRLGSHPVMNLDDFDAALRKFKPGDEVEITVVRSRQELLLKVILDRAK